MHIEKHGLQNLSIADRRSVLLLDNDSVLPNPESGTEGVDLSALDCDGLDVTIDQILGYKNLSEIEKERENTDPEKSRFGEAKWSEQSACDGFGSSYRDIKAILKASGMKNGDTFVDIGSSYGRVGCVVGANFPNSRFLGYEIVNEPKDLKEGS